MLAVSGNLNTTMYGPSMYPFVPRQALEGSSDPDKIWQPFDEKEASRRTIYAFIKRSMIVPMLEVLDFCDTARSSPKRINTSVAPQALTLFNGDFVNRQARHLAPRLARDAGPDPRRQIEYAYRLAFARRPTAEETAPCSNFSDEQGGGQKRAGAAMPRHFQYERIRLHGLRSIMNEPRDRRQFLWNVGARLPDARACRSAEPRWLLQPARASCSATSACRIHLQPSRRIFRPKPNTSYFCS